MKILRKTEDLKIDLNFDTDFQTNAGWQENMQQFEDEVLYEIVNPIDNYETIRYIHKPYSGITSFSGDTQCDIWFYFYFLNSNTSDYTNGLDYSHIGLTPQENAKLLKATSESFFRLEFYKTPIKGNTYEAPNRYNRRLVFAKNLSLPLGEKTFYSPIRKNIHVPVFMGSNYRNKENMYLFWFQDDSVLEETNLSGTTSNTNTFFMTAKFFNKIDGSIIDFTNSPFNSNYQINDVSDMYYQVDIDRTDYSYRIHRFNGTVSQYSDRVGIVTGNTIDGNMGVSPVRFYERRTDININTTQTPTPTVTPTPVATLTPTPTPTITPTTNSGGGSGSGTIYQDITWGYLPVTSPGYTTTTVYNGTSSPILIFLKGNSTYSNSGEFSGSATDANNLSDTINVSGTITGYGQMVYSMDTLNIPANSSMTINVVKNSGYNYPSGTSYDLVYATSIHGTKFNIPI